jgi:hypothetical protein
MNCAILGGMTFRGFGAAAALGLLACGVLPACSATANVSEVWMSIDEDGARRRSVFFTDSANVTCVAEVGVGRKDVTFELQIRRIRKAPFATDDFEPVNEVVSFAEFHPDVTKDKPATIALTMKPTSLDQDGKLKEDQEAPFDPGSYVCEVSLDGEKQKEAAFNIDYAPCPTVIIQPGTPCAGFYTIGTECPSSGATGDPEPTCSRSEKGWECN